MSPRLTKKKLRDEIAAAKQFAFDSKYDISFDGQVVDPDAAYWVLGWVLKMFDTPSKDLSFIEKHPTGGEEED